MDALVEKSRKLTGYLESLIDEIGDERISIITPRDPEQRGCQLSIRVKNADRSLHEQHRRARRLSPTGASPT